MNMNALTWVVVIYLALVVFRAVRRGFLRSVFSMAFLLVVVLVMAVGTPAVTKMCSESQYITEYVRKQTAAVIASAGSGSGSVTSKPTPARCPLSRTSTSAIVSMAVPRPALSRIAPCFIQLSLARFMNPIVSGVSGIQRNTISA